MPVTFNTRHLTQHEIALKGELPVEELELENVDKLIHPREPLKYDLVVGLAGSNVLVRGRLDLALCCECVRCLRTFVLPLKFEDWICSLPLEGEDKVLVDNDVVDLTPNLREDILLEFPQHPLCDAKCQGLPEMQSDRGVDESSRSVADESVWDELDKLKL